MNIQDEQNLRQYIKQALSEVLGEELEQFSDEVPLKEIYGVRYDSMSVLECVGALEKNLGINIDLLDDDLIHTFESVATIQVLVQKKLADQQSLADVW